MARIYNITDELSVSDSCLCFLTPNTKVLEFGSATGYATLYMVEKLNCTVTCVEKIPEMAAIGKQFAHKMIIADVDVDDWENELDCCFDYIIFADILEHLSHPEKVVAKAKNFLKEDGYIITSIPNIGHNAIIMSLRNGLFKYTETGLLDNTHIHFFTRESIFELFTNNDLFCIEEENKIIRPCDTELKCYYFQNPLLALSLISKNDAHVYRYVHKWGKNKIDVSELLSTQKLSITKRIFELLYDLACYIKRKINVDTPKILSVLIHKPIEKKEKKRYEKYNSKS
jgi:SAM-dependent methyltransferase